MGMYDIVETHCSCGHILQVQSKAGDCMLDTYNLSEVPGSIAHALHNEKIECGVCGKTYRMNFGINKFYYGRLEESHEL